LNKESLFEKIRNAISSLETSINVSVGTKILVPFFIIILIVVGLLSYFVNGKISETMEEMGARRAIAVLESTIQDVERERETVETYAHLLGDSMEIKQALDSGNKRRLYEILISSKQFSRLQKMVVFDKEGRIFVQIANSPTIHDDALKLVKKGVMGMNTSILTVSQNGLEIYAVSPIRPTTEIGGSPVLLLDRHIGESELRAVKKREGVDITLIYDGKVAASTLDNPLALRVLGDITESGGGAANQPTRLSGKDTDYINVWRPIGARGLISVTAPNRDLTAVKRELSGDIIRTTIISVFLVFLSATILARLMVGPLQKMLSTTRAITRGEFSDRVEVVTRDEFGELGAAINYMSEKIKERLDHAEHLATVDGLTGLYNHRYFQQRLAQEIQRAGRTGSSVSLLFIDIDYFKQYNDNLGHPAGDKVLRKIGKILMENIRSVDVAARYGGEEFAVILVDTGSGDAFEVGERIRRAIELHPFEGREQQPAGRVTVSLGIASYPENAVNKDPLIKLADDALYKAKKSKNTVLLAGD